MTTLDVSADRTQLIERLVTHRTLGSAPRRELEWLAMHGELQHYEPGKTLTAHRLVHVISVDVPGGFA